MELAEQLLAGHFRCDQPLRHVRKLVFGVEPRALGQCACKVFAKIGYAVAFACRYHEDIAENTFLVEPFGDLQKPLAGHQIDLVEGQDGLAPALLQPIDDGARIGIKAPLGCAASIDQQHDYIGVAGALPGARHHGPFEPAFGWKYARRIDEDKLRMSLGHYPAHDCARGLDLGRDNCDPGPDQGVEQRRFAGVGRAQ